MISLSIGAPVPLKMPGVNELPNWNVASATFPVVKMLQRRVDDLFSFLVITIELCMQLSAGNLPLGCETTMCEPLRAAKQ